MKNTFAKYFDFIFKILIIFVIALIWFRSYFHNNSQILLYSFLTTVACGFIFALMGYKKEQKFVNSKIDASQIDTMIQTLTFNTDKENLSLFANALKNKSEIKENKSYVSFLSNAKKIGIVINYEVATITDNIVLKIYKQFKNIKLNKLFVCCNNFDKKAFDLTNKLTGNEIILLNNKNTYYSIFKRNNYVFEKNKKIKQNKKDKFKNYLFLAFNRKKTKGYLFAGIVLLIGSVFMRYNIYYLIWTSIMFLFALFSLFNKPFNPKINSDIFETNI